MGVLHTVTDGAPPSSKTVRYFGCSRRVGGREHFHPSGNTYSKLAASLLVQLTPPSIPTGSSGPGRPLIADEPEWQRPQAARSFNWKGVPPILPSLSSSWSINFSMFLDMVNNQIRYQYKYYYIMCECLFTFSCLFLYECSLYEWLKTKLFKIFKIFAVNKN